MHTLKGIFLSLLAASPVTVFLSVLFMPSANAQAVGQTLAQCVKELNDAYPYNVNKEVHFEHIQTCQNVLSSQTPKESLGQCVASLNRIYPYNAGREITASHTQICSNLLQTQQSNFNRPTRLYPNVTQPPQPSRPNNEAYNQAPNATTQQIAECMQDLMFDQEYVCTDPDGKCGVFSSYWKQQNVATGISEDAAVRACTAGGR